MSNYIAKQPGENGHIEFTDEENGTWQLLYQRQAKIIIGRACDAFIEGLHKLDMPKDRVPQCYEVTERLQQLTGWSVIPVPAMISLKQFFTMLSHREFPAASFIRRREELDYLKEPDIFHEYFGHCPMITDQKIADFMQWYGETALTAPKEVQSLLGRLFWFTIEFGLIQSKEAIRIFGGGILSSFEETQFAVDSDEPIREPFNIIKILKTDYRYDQIQKRYFVIEDLSALDLIRSSNIVELAKHISSGKDQDDFVLC